MQQPVLIAFLLTLFAGLSTGVGSGIAFFAGESKVGFLSFGLGFSAGVMVYISFVEILPKSIDSIAGVYDPKLATWIGVGGLFLGMVITALIDKLVPEHENPHEVRSHEDLDRLKSKSASSEEVRSSSSLMRTGVLTALAIGIHNFPEG
ncbi:unnamed protein product, partial [marine sediment metagenome]